MKTFSPAYDFFRTSLLAKLKYLAQPLATHFGLNAFAYSRVSHDGFFYQISNTPEQSIRYWEIDLYEKNIFLQSPDSYEAGFYLLREVQDNNFQQMLDGCSQVGAEFYLRIVRKESNLCHQFLFGATQHISFVTMFFNNINILESFCDYFLEAAADILKQCDKFTFSLPELLGNKYACTQLRTPHGIKSENKIQYFTQISKRDSEFHRGFSELTNREKECITQFLQGKTAGQIGTSLDISKRTVEHYLENIKSKLGCSSKPELFNKLQTHGRMHLL